MITVGISCYNIERYIARAITSVLAQTHENLEILIVDDGSTDTSGAICDEYAARDPRIRVIHQENAGPGVARNRVLEEMRGAWVAFVDGDDYVEPEMYETMLAACRTHDAPLAVCGYATERDNTGGLRATNESWGTGTMTHFSAGNDQPVQCAEKRVIVPVPADSLAARSTHVLPRDELLTRYIEEDERTPIRNAVWNKLMRRDLVESLRMPGQKSYEDILFTARLLAAADKAVFVDRPLYHYIIDREGSIMNQGINEGIVSDQIPSYHAREDFLRSIGREDLACTEAYLSCKKLLTLYAETVWPYRGRKRVLSGREVSVLRDGITKALRDYGRHADRIYRCRIAGRNERFKMKMFLAQPVLYRLFTMLNDGIIRPLRGL